MSEIKLILGDCLEEMKKIPDKSIDLIITSPPYNQNLTTQCANRVLYKDNIERSEYLNFIKCVFNNCFRILKDEGSFFYNYKTQVANNILEPAFEHLVNVKNNFLLAGEIIWKFAGNFDSARCRFPTDYEMIYHLVKCKDFYFTDNKEPLTSVWNIKHVMHGTEERYQASVHPCPFPVAMIKKIITHTSKKNDVILDPFMGSGTTGVACKELGRNFIGIEISPEYFEIAERRINQATTELFA